MRTLAQPGAFDPEAIAAMTEAFDVVCENLGDTDQPEVAREVIAGRIIAAARLGERDPARCWKLRSANRTSQSLCEPRRLLSVLTTREVGHGQRLRYQRGRRSVYDADVTRP
jgi:hypothetical protein